MDHTKKIVDQICFHIPFPLSKARFVVVMQAAPAGLVNVRRRGLSDDQMLPSLRFIFADKNGGATRNRVYSGELRNFLKILPPNLFRSSHQPR